MNRYASLAVALFFGLGSITRAQQATPQQYSTMSHPQVGYFVSRTAGPNVAVLQSPRSATRAYPQTPTPAAPRPMRVVAVPVAAVPAHAPAEQRVAARTQSTQLPDADATGAQIGAVEPAPPEGAYEEVPPPAMSYPAPNPPPPQWHPGACESGVCVPPGRPGEHVIWVPAEYSQDYSALGHAGPNHTVVPPMHPTAHCIPAGATVVPSQPRPYYCGIGCGCYQNCSPAPFQVRPNLWGQDSTYRPGASPLTNAFSFLSPQW
jgi:hypothetical protein